MQLEVFTLGGRELGTWLQEVCMAASELTAVTIAKGGSSTLRLSRSNELAVAKGQRMTSLFDLSHGRTQQAEYVLSHPEMPYYVGFGPMQMKVLDRRTVMAAGPPVAERVSVMLIERPDAVAAAMHYTAVVKSKSVAVRDLVLEPVDLTARQHAVAQLLAQGHGDDSIARTLGISVRTARAEFAVLSTALNAASRFAAGFKYAMLVNSTPAMTAAAHTALADLEQPWSIDGRDG
ncbi:helix-turn-helix transcriptional regulator [Nocardioides speluncae]|uniref:helix-turn-helix transcriptional regulator n=1 Tax=Nocardioides speluncae TaxID=2670337 RepID=UPI00137B938C|nr:LuxR C-terminal-related transcriptional regulator [Nocardioides speluncae]